MTTFSWRFWSMLIAAILDCVASVLRKLVTVLGVSFVAAAILRVKGKSEISTRRGGWRQVNPPISE